MAFQFEIKLSRMALLAYALSLWKKGDMPRKLKQFYYPYGRKGKMPFLKELVNEVIKSIDQTSLPSPLYHELLDVVKGVAYKTYNWFNFIRRKKVFCDQSRRQIYDKFLKNVYWTHYGTIDEVKIIKYSWLKIPNVDLTKLYVMACYFCSEDLIEELWDKISETDFAISHNKLCKRKGFHLVVYWNKLRENKLGDVFSDCIVWFFNEYNMIYDVHQSVEVNMLRMAANKGFARAVRYFWNKLSDHERNKNIKYCLSIALAKYEKEESFEHYRKDQFTEIIFFLMNFSNAELNKNIFTQRKISKEGSLFVSAHKHLSVILKICTSKWPWYEFFNSVFSKVVNFLDDNVCYLLIRNLTKRSSVQNNIFNSRLRLAWQRIPRKCKMSVLKCGIGSGYLHEKCNLSTIKHIINDDAFVTERENITNGLLDQIIYMIRNNELDKVSEYVDEVIIPDNLSDDIKGVTKSLYKLIMRGKINLADESLKFFSEEKIKRIKSIVNADIICYYFVIKNEFDFADEFLNWKYDTKQKVEAFKNDFKKNYFIKDQIRILWRVSKKKVEVTKKNCDRLLLWFLEKEVQVILYKATVILPDVFSSQWQPYVDSRYHFDVLEDFLQWAILNDETIQKFKINVFKNELFTLTLPTLVRSGRFEEATKICKWTFNSDEEMYKNMREFLLSDNGIIACKLFISKYSSLNMFNPPTVEEMTIKFKSFIDFLMKSLINVSELTEKLKDWPGESKHVFEEIGSDDSSTQADNSDAFDCEGEGVEDIVGGVYYVYCKVDNYKLFWSLLNEVENDSDV